MSATKQRPLNAFDRSDRAAINELLRTQHRADWVRAEVQERHAELATILTLTFGEVGKYKVSAEHPDYLVFEREAGGKSLVYRRYTRRTGTFWANRWSIRRLSVKAAAERLGL